MSTATFAAHNGSADQGPFIDAVRSKLAGRSVKASLDLAITRGREWLAAGLQRLHAARIYTMIRSRAVPIAAWAAGLLSTAGPGSVAVYAATTHRGRDLAYSLGARAYRLATFPVRFAFRQIAKVTGRLGKAGLVVNATVPMFVERCETYVSKKAQSLLSWIADRHDTAWMKTVRSITWLQVCARVIRRFVPVGWMRVVAYGAIVFIPNTSSDPTINPKTGKFRQGHQSVASTVLDVVPGVMVQPEKAATIPTDAEVAVAVLPEPNNRAERRENDRLVSSAGNGGKQTPGRKPNHQR